MNNCDNLFARKIESCQDRNDFCSSSTTFVFKTMSSVNETFKINLSKQSLKLFCETSKSVKMTHILLYEKKSINLLKSKILCEILASCSYFNSWHMNAQDLLFHDYYSSLNICVSNERNHFLQSWNNSLFSHDIFISVFFLLLFRSLIEN